MWTEVDWVEMHRTLHHCCEIAFALRIPRSGGFWAYTATVRRYGIVDLANMQNVKATRKGKKGPVPARVFMLFARKSPVSLIFRRGPSKWVQLIKWNTKDDSFEPGQWFHGRIYERRCDLSPDGSLLIYFAQKLEGRRLRDENDYTYAWTAVSKTPYLTALALWPKGDCWHGGGLFKDAKTVVLNHRPEVAKAHPRHRPKKLRVLLKEHVSGEDDPLFSERLDRDGWNLEKEWKVENRGYPQLFRTLQPEIRHKISPDRKFLIQLIRSIEGLDYSEEFSVGVATNSPPKAIERASWADWDQQGRLVFARDGKVYSAQMGERGDIFERELADFTSSKPTAVPSPLWATNW